MIDDLARLLAMKASNTLSASDKAAGTYILRVVVNNDGSTDYYWDMNVPSTNYEYDDSNNDGNITINYYTD
jgi:hypothetical protein